jgi:hypothetical protein
MIGLFVIARSEANEAIQNRAGSLSMALDCFAEPVIRRRFAPTGWLAKTINGATP